MGEKFPPELMEEKFPPDLCEECQMEEKDLVSIKDGKRCRFAKPTRWTYDRYWGPLDGCKLKVTAKCGHQTDKPRYSHCIGAVRCDDFQPKPAPQSKPTPRWVFWK